MLSHGHQLQDPPEFREVDSFLRSQRMLVEEGDDSFIQVIRTPHPICHSLSMIRSNHAAPKELFERMQQLDIALVLNNCELRKHLESRSHLWVFVNADKETTFAVNKSNHPLRFQFSGV